MMGGSWRCWSDGEGELLELLIFPSFPTDRTKEERDSRGELSLREVAVVSSMELLIVTLSLAAGVGGSVVLLCGLAGRRAQLFRALEIELERENREKSQSKAKKKQKTDPPPHPGGIAAAGSTTPAV